MRVLRGLFSSSDALIFGGMFAALTLFLGAKQAMPSSVSIAAGSVCGALLAFSAAMKWHQVRFPDQVWIAADPAPWRRLSKWAAIIATIIAIADFVIRDSHMHAAIYSAPAVFICTCATVVLQHVANNAQKEKSNSWQS